MRRHLYTSVTLVVLGCLRPATPALADEVDELLTAAMANRHIPGLSVGVIQDGKLVKARGYGLANVEFSAWFKAG
jgi:CubicO group peptidase (beta-lactamase class C family)